MELKTSTWYKGMVAIERGPLVFSLKVESENRQKDRKDRFRAFWEVFPKSDWNYALEESVLGNLSENVALIEREWNGDYPWNLENAPIELRLKGVHLPEWRTVKSAPELSENIPQVISPAELERRKREITLVPYGCTTLRITEFPVVRVE
jgi:uncharacterized protein